MSIRTSHGVLFGALAALNLIGSARAEDIKIGEINSYSLLPAFTEPYRKGWQLAVEEINAAGGVNGKKLVVVSKDDGGKPADARDRRQRARRRARTWRCWPARSSRTSACAVADFANAEEGVLPRRPSR